LSKLAVITGGSGGIGLACARLLASEGWEVCSLSRMRTDPPKEAAIRFLKADVADEKSLKEAMESAGERIDLLICCAGSGISGAVKYTEESEAAHQMDVNFMGVFRTVKAALPRMGRGSAVVLVGSVAGLLPIPFQAFYSASKAAITSLGLSLDNELRPFGIRVRVVMPGDVKTGFTAARRRSTEGDEEYGGMISRSVSRMERDEQSGLTPESVAKVILKAARGRRPLYVAGTSYRVLCFIARLLPWSIVNRILGIMYAK